MFDDIAQPPKPGSTPSNLPVGEPEDMFQETDSSNEVGATSTSQPSDFSEFAVPANTALDAGVLRPKVVNASPLPVSQIPNSGNTQSAPARPETISRPQSVPQPFTIQNPPSPFLSGSENYPQPTGSAAAEAPFSGRKILIFVGVILVLIVLGVGSLYIYTHFIKNDTVDDFTSTVTDTASDTNSDVIPPVTNPTSTNTTSEEDSVLFGEPVDTDSDGISDVDEQKYSTDTLNWDTDGDELSDGDEVMIWKTDPRVLDSDNDGYGDGVEIKNGYNPTGTGKLFEPPTSASTSTTP